MKLDIVDRGEWLVIKINREQWQKLGSAARLPAADYRYDPTCGALAFRAAYRKHIEEAAAAI